MLILFLLKILEKLVLIIYGVIALVLCKVKLQMILLWNFFFFIYNYQKELKSIRESEFVLESADALDYKLHRVRLKRGGSYIISPKWLKNKKAVINPKK